MANVRAQLVHFFRNEALHARAGGAGTTLRYIQARRHAETERHEETQRQPCVPTRELGTAPFCTEAAPEGVPGREAKASGVLVPLMVAAASR